MLRREPSCDFHLDRYGGKPLECFLHREPIFKSIVAQDQIEASLVIRVALHYRIVLAYSILRNMTCVRFKHSFKMVLVFGND